MGCCNGKKTGGQARAEIATGQVKALFAMLTGLPSYAKTRLEVCLTCPHRTWMTTFERVGWIIDNLGVIMGRTGHIPDETADLPVRPDHVSGSFLCCRICRCVCRKKVLVKTADCCKGLWGPPKNL